MLSINWSVVDAIWRNIQLCDLEIHSLRWINENSTFKLRFLHIPYDISIDWDNINISLLFVTLLNNNGYTFPKIYKNGYSVWNIQIYEHDMQDGSPT
jgi:hypothetical protein